VDVLGLVFVFLVILVEGDAGHETAESLTKLVGELVEDMEELLLLFILALVPVSRLKLVDERLEDIIDDGVQSGNRVLGDLTEEDLIVRLGLWVDGAISASFFVFGGASKEVHTLAE